MEIAIITHNSQTALQGLIKGLEKSKTKTNLKIHIVDNLSGDDTLKIAKSSKLKLNIIDNKANLGYGRAANVAIKNCKSDFLLLLNPDIKTDVKTLEKIAELTKSKKFLEKKTTLSSPKIFHYKNKKKSYDNFCAEISSKADYTDCNWISGAVMLINIKEIRKLGAFDENIFLFYEETDLCKRVIKSGQKIAIINDIELEHSRGKSSPDNVRYQKIKYFHHGWSKAYFTTKHSKNAFVKNIKSLLVYDIKFMLSLLSFNKKKYIKSLYKTMGCLFYLIGLKAFDNKGKARYT
jgi:GT2 family glycosyltransferase